MSKVGLSTVGSATVTDVESVEIGIASRTYNVDLLEFAMRVMDDQLRAHIEANGLTVVEDVQIVKSGPTFDLVTGQEYWGVGAHARVLPYE